MILGHWFQPSARVTDLHLFIFRLRNGVGVVKVVVVVVVADKTLRMVLLDAFATFPVALLAVPLIARIMFFALKVAAQSTSRVSQNTISAQSIIATAKNNVVNLVI
jgi:hypothetical protein